MGMHTLGAALDGALASALKQHVAQRSVKVDRTKSVAPNPTRSQILRDSIEAGTFEEQFFVPPAKGETDRLLRAARRSLDAGRQLRREARQGLRMLTPAERLLTTLTNASVRVLEEILTLSRLNRGRIFPSYDYLARATSLGRATVARAIGILEAIGFLTRKRRFKRISTEGPGPRYKQTSNAYRTSLPQTLLAYLPRWMRPAPLPEDEIHRRTEHDDEIRRMHSQLSCSEWAQATIDGPLSKVLARLGAAIDRQQRESQMHTQTLLHSNDHKDQASAMLPYLVL